MINHYINTIYLHDINTWSCTRSPAAAPFLCSKIDALGGILGCPG